MAIQVPDQSAALDRAQRDRIRPRGTFLYLPARIGQLLILGGGQECAPAPWGHFLALCLFHLLYLGNSPDRVLNHGRLDCSGHNKGSRDGTWSTHRPARTKDRLTFVQPATFLCKSGLLCKASD